VPGILACREDSQLGSTTLTRHLAKAALRATRLRLRHRRVGREQPAGRKGV